MDSLVIVTKRFRKEFPIRGDVITIGRSLENTICLNDPSISRHHSRICRRGGSYYIEDLGSHNGTLVNGERIVSRQERELRDGDEISIANYQLICRFSSSGEDLEAGSGGDLEENLAVLERELEGAEGLGGGDRPSFIVSEEGGEDSHRALTREIAYEDLAKFLPHSSSGQVQGGGDGGEGVVSKSSSASGGFSSGSSGEDLGRLQASLMVKEGGEQRRFELVSKSVSVGRASDNGLVLSHSSVSKYHARIVYRGDGFYVEDLGSTNGTLVNDILVESFRLEDGDRINFGQVEAYFSCVHFPASRRFRGVSEERVSRVLIRCGLLSRGDYEVLRREAEELGVSLRGLLLERGIINTRQWAEACKRARHSSVVFRVVLGVVVFLLLVFLLIGILLRGSWEGQISRESRRKLLYRVAVDAFKEGRFELALEKAREGLKLAEGSEAGGVFRRLMGAISAYSRAEELMRGRRFAAAFRCLEGDWGDLREVFDRLRLRILYRWANALLPERQEEACYKFLEFLRLAPKGHPLVSKAEGLFLQLCLSRGKELRRRREYSRAVKFYRSVLDRLGRGSLGGRLGGILRAYCEVCLEGAVYYLGEESYPQSRELLKGLLSLERTSLVVSFIEKGELIGLVLEALQMWEQSEGRLVGEFRRQIEERLRRFEAINRKRGYFSSGGVVLEKVERLKKFLARR